MGNHTMMNNKSLPPGCVLNERYTIINTLGEGGFSITYSAMHNDIKKIMAIKEYYCSDYMYRDIRISQEIHLDDSSDSIKLTRELQNFLKEARILAELSKVQGVVHVTDYFRENGTAYIVMELVEGKSLEILLQNGTLLTWKEAITSFLPIITALSIIHKKGLLHRDIKPDNIIVSDNGSFTLIDFGAALHITGEETHSVYLTEGFAPKEQYLRSGILTPCTDVYALCAVLYRCITGQIPQHSIQRAVFDELKTPSELKIHIPNDFESVLKKGLQVEPENRWKNMEELHDACAALLPTPKKHNRAIYVLIGIAAAFLFTMGTYIVNHCHEIKMNRMAENGEAIVFRLDAPEGMSTEDFKEAIRLTEIRADAFAGTQNYLIDSDASSITLTIPWDCFDIADDWSTEFILHTCFEFTGKWLLHNSDVSKYFELTPPNITHIELNYGVIPLVTRSGEPMYYNGEVIDWSSEEIYYLKMELDQEAREFLNEYLSQEGYMFLASAHLDSGESINAFYWISQGDGKTVYFPIESLKSKNYAGTMYKILTTGVFSSSLELSWEDERNIRWLQPGAEDKYMCSVNDFSTPTVEIKCKFSSSLERDNALNLCKTQLSLLEIPFSLGQDENILHLRVPSDKMCNIFLVSLLGANMDVRSAWGKRIIFATDFMDVNVAYEDNDKGMLIIYLNKDILNEIKTDIGQESLSKNDLMLFLGDVRIGELSSCDFDHGSLQFRILLPEDGTGNISSHKMLDYFCNIASGKNYDYPSYEKPIFRDARNTYVAIKDYPLLSDGIDVERFSSLFSDVNRLGGNSSFVIDTVSGEEKIKIKFDNWNGNFPEDALEMIEDVFRNNGLANNICNNISFEIHSWYKGDSVAITTSFFPESSSKSVICIGGTVECNDAIILEKAKNYIEKSNILTATDDRFVDKNWTTSYSSEWNYRSRLKAGE